MQRANHADNIGAKIMASAGIVTLALTIAAFIATGHIQFHRDFHLSPDPLYIRASLRSYELWVGILISVFLLQPLITATIGRLRESFSETLVPLLLIATCAALTAFIILVGRHQFGGYDFNVLIDIGWRQMLRQHLYTDFLTPTPPGFNLGIKYAFELFGITWNANLYLCAIFASGTFLWMYWLLRQLKLPALAAMTTAVAIEAEAMLLTDFWWYNNTTLVLAAVFLLACLAYLRRAESIATQISFVTALALLALMKPNIAGITIAGGMLLLLCIPGQHRRQLPLLVACSVAAVLLLLRLNHVSIPAMLASYREASRERGGFSTFGYDQLERLEREIARSWYYAVLFLALCLIPRVIRLVRQREPHIVTACLFFLLSLAVSFYGILTNGDFRQVESPPLFAAAAVLIFGTTLPSPVLRRLFTATLFACIVSDLYIGTTRLRVYTIGPGIFHTWTDNDNLIPSGVLKDMRVGGDLVHIQQEIATAVRASSGPFFFGPRVDFSYADLSIPSPENLPVWWAPGTSFARSMEPELVERWKEHQFRTLIFLKNDYTFYPPSLLNAITQDYLRDESYPGITVYHRRPATRAALEPSPLPSRESHINSAN